MNTVLNLISVIASYIVFGGLLYWCLDFIIKRIVLFRRTVVSSVYLHQVISAFISIILLALCTRPYYPW